MPQGGTLKITTKISGNTSQSSNKFGSIEVTFQDIGCGIKAVDVSKVFDPFFYHQGDW